MRVDFDSGYQIVGSVYVSKVAVGQRVIEGSKVEEIPRKDERVNPVSGVPEEYDPLYYFVGKFLDVRV
jgi:hypothetical protein